MLPKEYFSIRLKELRLQRKLTQEQLGQELGVIKQSVGNWESGIRLPNLEMLAAIANYFNVSVDYLLGKENSSPVIATLCENNDEIFQIVKKDFLKAISNGDIPLTAFPDISVDEFLKHFENLPRKTQVEVVSQVVPQITFGDKNISIQYAFPGESDATQPVDLENILNAADLRFHNISLTESDKQDIRTMLEIIFKKRELEKETD